MLGRTLALVVVMLGCGAPGDALASAAVAPGSRAYASELAAVIAASSAVNPRSIREDREFLGAVFRRGDEYAFSVAPGHAGADRIRVPLHVPDGFELVALWHTHGAAGSGRSYFSTVDAALVARTGKPLYLADPTGALRVLRPGAPTLSALGARQRGLPSRRGYAAGEQLSGPDGERVHIPIRSDTALSLAVNN